MKSLVRIDWHPHGPRVYLLRVLRLHHGLTGFAAATLGAWRHNPRLAALGVLLCAHDRRDFPWV